jgi:hypothetical protein
MTMLLKSGGVWTLVEISASGGGTHTTTTEQPYLSTVVIAWGVSAQQ